MAIPRVLLFMGSQLNASSRDMEEKRARVAIIVDWYNTQHSGTKVKPYQFLRNTELDTTSGFLNCALFGPR